MKKVIVAAFVAGMMLWPVCSQAANSVIVESISAEAGEAGVTVGVFIENDVELGAITLPLEIREIDAGSFITNAFAVDIQGRVGASGLLDFASLVTYPSPDLVNSCSGPTSNTYAGGAPMDFVSPDALLWNGLVTVSPCFDPGTDGAVPSVLLTFDVTIAAGQFEIDTCCIWPANHIMFVDCAVNLVPASFTKGVVTIEPCDCPFTGDPVADGTANVFDVVLVQKAVIGEGSGSFDPHCPYPREDINCDGLVNGIDLILIIDLAFNSASRVPCDPCDCLADPPSCDPPIPSPGSAIFVESKTVAPSAVGVEIGIYVQNDVDVRSLSLPLEIREVTPGAFMANSYSMAVQGRVGASGLTEISAQMYFDNPAPSNDCSGPVALTYTGGGLPGVPSSPTDAVLWSGLSSTSPCMAMGTDGSPGSGTPSFLLTFDVTGTSGTFEIDTCCVTPANHLVIVECGTLTSYLPTFTKGVVTIGAPPACFRTETDPYLLACPKGDIFFDVTLKDGAGNPLVGHEAWLDFSDCSPTEFLPQPGEYPSWPLVYSLLPSDENGLVRFAIAAGGSCTNCDVTVHTACGFTTTVPVRSVDVDGDMCVTILDRAAGLGICRDVNADGLVNEFDFLRLADHCCGHCFPNNPCDRLSLNFAELGCGPQPEEIVELSWTIYNDQKNVPCDLDSLVIYETMASIPPVWEWVDVITVGQTLAPGDARTETLEFMLPPLREFGIMARLYTDCCDSFLVEKHLGGLGCQCPPDSACFEFYVQRVAPFDDTVVTWSSPDLELIYGWTISIRDTINDSVAPGPLTVVEICTSDNTPVGRGGILTIDFCPAGGFCQEKLQFEVWQRYFEGDLCGGPNRTPDCKVDVFDVVCLVDYIFRNGPPPTPPENADINCDEVPDVFDIVTLVDYVFRNNAQPPDCNAGPGQF